MVQATFDLPEETLAALKTMAEADGSTVDSLAARAMQEFVALREMSEEEYQRRWDELLSKVRTNVPPGMTEEEIEAEIDAATDEVWAERRASANRR